MPITQQRTLIAASRSQAFSGALEVLLLKVAFTFLRTVLEAFLGFSDLSDGNRFSWRPVPAGSMGASRAQEERGGWQAVPVAEGHMARRRRPLSLGGAGGGKADGLLLLAWSGGSVGSPRGCGLRPIPRPSSGSCKEG